MVKFTSLAFLLLASVSVQAAIITETWTADISSLNNNEVNSPSTSVRFNGFSINDKITWSVSYDTLFNDRYTRFNDGLDGKSDRGGNDDTLNTLVCLDKSISSKCDVELPNGVALYDSVTEVSAIYQTMVGFLNQHENVYDFFEYNEDIRRFQSLQDSNLTINKYIADDFIFYADNRIFPVGGTGSAELFYEKNNGDIWSSRIGFGNIEYTSSISQVPEPSIPALMGAGFAGLGFARRRKKEAK